MGIGACPGALWVNRWGCPSPVCKQDWGYYPLVHTWDQAWALQIARGQFLRVADVCVRSRGCRIRSLENSGAGERMMG